MIGLYVAFVAWWVFWLALLGLALSGRLTP